MDRQKNLTKVFFYRKTNEKFGTVFMQITFHFVNPFVCITELCTLVYILHTSWENKISPWWIFLFRLSLRHVCNFLPHGSYKYTSGKYCIIHFKFTKSAAYTAHVNVVSNYSELVCCHIYLNTSNLSNNCITKITRQSTSVVEYYSLYYHLWLNYQWLTFWESSPSQFG